MRVCIYKNLRNGLWSICEATPTGNRGKLIRHADVVALANVVFVVKESRRQVVCAKRCREVHAWCVGDLIDAWPTNANLTEVTYNPYRAPTFTTRKNTPVHAAKLVVFTDLARASL